MRPVAEETLDQNKWILRLVFSGIWSKLNIVRQSTACSFLIHRRRALPLCRSKNTRRNTPNSQSTTRDTRPKRDIIRTNIDKEDTADQFVPNSSLTRERDAIVVSTETADCQKRRVARCCGANNNMDKTDWLSTKKITEWRKRRVEHFTNQVVSSKVFRLQWIVTLYCSVSPRLLGFKDSNEWIHVGMKFYRCFISLCQAGLLHKWNVLLPTAIEYEGFTHVSNFLLPGLFKAPS